jgi:cobalt/nickel transport system ATP-binding protein
MIFELKEVGYRYPDGAEALRGVNLTIASGEKIAILGANGSGKSTLIRILDGLLFASEGTVTAFGEELTETALAAEAKSHAFRRKVGFVFQNSEAQLFSGSVREELAFGPLQLGLTREETEQRIADVCRLLEIEHLLDRPPFHLSGGEKKRVAIACTLSVNPQVILLDEPTGGLDPRSQYWLVELLVKLHEAGKTVITATHELNIVSTIADRAIVFSEEHTIAADAACDEVLANMALLQNVNLIHPDLHRHDGVFHAHRHGSKTEHHHHA